jgi:hypothetical protein
VIIELPETRGKGGPPAVDIKTQMYNTISGGAGLGISAPPIPASPMANGGRFNNLFEGRASASKMKK